MMTDIEIEIDGRKLTVKSNQTIIEAADIAGIYIPRFCYHKHLSIAANCRMCLVEVEKAPKPMPACATPVTPNMKVSTRSKKTIDAQRAVMEFLLINHPLDCPICDQGGECELQDFSMGYGSDDSPFDELKRAVPELNLGPLIATEMTRCIHCTRCVRFGDEVAGFREMGATYRGEHTEIGTYIQHSIQSEVSGNIIDLCPVGALTSKPFRFTARAWELQQAPGISPHDAYGSNLYIHTRDGVVMRVVPKENQSLNQTWISDRDRFSYTALTSEDRVKSPMIRSGGHWQEVSWEEALQYAVEKITTIQKTDSEQIVGLTNPSATVEECYLLQKIIRGLGSSHIDHRLNEVDTQDENYVGLYPGFNFTLDEFAESDAVLIIGSRLTHELPLLAARLRQMVKRGTEVVVLNAVDDDMHFFIHQKAIISPINWLTTIERWKIIIEGKSKRAIELEVEQITSFLKSKKKITILVGQQVASHPDASSLRFAITELAASLQAKVGYITEGANSAGAWLAGAIPHRGPAMEVVKVGNNACEMIKSKHLAYILLNVEPTYDVSHPIQTMDALSDASFVLSLSTFQDPSLMKTAHVILPISPFTETSGTYVNAFGEWQSFRGVAKPYESCRPAWKVLRVLGELLGLSDFGYESSEVIRDELKALCMAKADAKDRFSSFQPKEVQQLFDHDLVCIKEKLIYRSDGLSRRSAPLQEAQFVMSGDIFSIAKIHPDTAKHCNVKDQTMVTLMQGEESIKAQLHYDKTIALDTIWIAAATDMSAGLNHHIGSIKLVV